MAAVQGFLTAVAVLLCCIGPLAVRAGMSVEEMRGKLSAVESHQTSLRQTLRSAEQLHDNDIGQLGQVCLDLKASMEEQRQILEEIQQSLGGEGNAEGGEEDNIMNGPCHPNNHSIIDDSKRLVGEPYYGYDELCDRNLDEGWYRFQLDGESAVIPTYCVSENNCYTDASTWVDLQGESLPAPGHQVEARACSNWVGDCCNWEAPITVFNCGQYLVYYIEPLKACDLAFCAEPQG